jgi:phosphonate transport system substrate-binding protein
MPRTARAGVSTAILVITGLVLLLSCGCDKKENAKEIDLKKRERVTHGKSTPGEEPLRIAIGSMIAPEAGFAYYRELLDYIGEKLGRPVLFVGKGKYSEVNDSLRTGKLDVAFVCSGPYVEGHKKFGMELLAVPQAYGKEVYYSYIIVARDSPVRSFGELRGKTFAFADPDSNSGTIFPTYLLAKMHETPKSFFKNYGFTYAHDKSIRAVAEKLVEGAAVDSLVWNYLEKAEPGSTGKTRIILKSEPFGIPPVVVRPGLDTKTKKRLREIFLNLDRDERGRRILKGMMLDKFVAGNDSTYDSVRAMKSVLAGPGNKEE